MSTVGTDPRECADKACAATTSAACKYPGTEGGWPGHCIRSLLLAAEADSAEVERCPECRHVPHASMGFCPNMASDNDCACTYGATSDADETPPPASGDVEALVIEAQEFELSEADYARLGSCNCAHCEDGDGICPQTVAALIGEHMDDLAQRAQALIAARDAIVRDDERAAWSAWLDNWMSAVGPKPPTVEAVATWLRADQRPFGTSRGDS